MNKRPLCAACSRPRPTCICKHIQPVANLVPVLILQHPKETFETKNSAGLLQRCLKNSQLEVGEVFHKDFFQARRNQGYYDLLLYPDTSEDKSLGIASPPIIDPSHLGASDHTPHPIRLWVVDATWRKSRKMLYLNPALQAMPRLSLQHCPTSLYTIRKAHSENQLSTLEASCYALQQLEHNAVDYSPVLHAFTAFVAEQQAFLPSTPLSSPL